MHDVSSMINQLPTPCVLPPPSPAPKMEIGLIFNVGPPKLGLELNQADCWHIAHNQCQLDNRLNPSFEIHLSGVTAIFYLFCICVVVIGDTIIDLLATLACIRFNQLNVIR